MSKQMNFGGNNVNIEGDVYITLTKPAVKALLAKGILKKFNEVIALSVR